jgi:hypothetical protein
VTCSKAGLHRLDHLVTTDPEKANQIKHATLHVVTPEGLKEVANTFDEDSEETPYLLTYAKLRTALVNELNLLSNLESITITNGQLQDITEPPFRLVDQRGFERFDPICEVDRKTQGYRLTPCLYAFESALSIMPLLTNNPSLHLAIDYANLDRDLMLCSSVLGRRMYRPFLNDSIAHVLGPESPQPVKQPGSVSPTGIPGILLPHSVPKMRCGLAW